MPKLSEIIDKIEGLVITTSKKAAGIMSETLTAIEPELEKDLKIVIQNGIPIALSAFTSGGVSAAITVAIAYIKAELPVLGEELWTALGAELALKAKSLSPVAAPVITTIPSAGA